MTCRTRTAALLRIVSRPALVAGALVTIGSIPAARASAAVPAPFVAFQQALAALHSYRQVSTIVTVGHRGAASTTVSTTVVVRHAGHRRVYIKTTTATGTLLNELVGTGAHLCRRNGENNPWSCTTPDTLASAFPSTMSAIRTIDAGLHVTFLTMGVRQGQRCREYALRGSSRETHFTGTIWIAVATAYPIEEDTTYTISAGDTQATSRVHFTWSDENNPRLTIPTVPAS